MLKTCFFKFLLIDINWVSYILEFLYSFFMLSSQELYLNPGCLECIPGMNLSPTNKNVIHTAFILYIYKKLPPAYSLDLLTLSQSLSLILVSSQETFCSFMFLLFFNFGITDKFLLPKRLNISEITNL